MRRQTREAGEKLIGIWRDETTETELELPSSLQPADRAHICAFCDEQGLAHETVEADGTTVLRVRRAAPTAASGSEMTEAQRERVAANKAAAIARRAAAASSAATSTTATSATVAPAAIKPAPVMTASAPAPVQTTAAPAAAATLTPNDQAMVDELSGVANAAELRELSDSLDVSSALYLGAQDMLKLRTMLEQPHDLVHAERVLRRLSMTPMTSKLDETTGFVALMAELRRVKRRFRRRCRPALRRLCVRPYL